MNWKGFGRKLSWSNRGIISEFTCRELGKQGKFSVMISGVPA
jgi:hypothetical protein